MHIYHVMAVVVMVVEHSDPFPQRSDLGCFYVVVAVEKEDHEVEVHEIGDHEGMNSYLFLRVDHHKRVPG